MMQMLGLDVSKASLSATLVDPTTRLVQWQKTVPNTPAGVGQLLGLTPPQSPWVLEPTGRYSLGVARQAQAAERTVLLAPPRQARAFLAALRPRAKTDRLDSGGLALYGIAASLTPYPIKSEAVDTLDQLLAARRGLSQALMRLEQQLNELPASREALAPAIAALKAQRKVIDRQLAAQRRLPGADRMVAEVDRVPGIGPVTAAAVVSRLRDKTFPDADAFVAYLGLDVRVRQSGRRQGKQALSKQGDAELRRLLFLCAQANLRTAHSPFKAQFERERAKGLSTTAATCAVARKLARLCWSLVKYERAYDPQRVYTQPSPDPTT
jgi:transposase